MQSIKRLCLLLIFTLFATGTMIAGQVLAADWYDPDWNYRKMITIDSTKVPNTDQSNFPVLINTTNVDWRDTTNGGKVGQSDGGDILFTDSDGTTKLSHEIEKYNPSTGELVAWVNVPTVSASSDTDIYIYYGNTAGGLAEWETDGSTWNSDFVMVQHLWETSGTHSDSTSNGNNGTPQNGVIQNATGQINGADNFDGTNDYVNAGNDASLNLVNNFTLEAWIYPQGGGIIINKENVYEFARFSDGSIRWAFRNTNPGWFWINTNGNAPLDQWTHVVITYSSTAIINTYLNGNLVDTYSGAGNVQVNANALWIAGRLFVSQFFDGTIDEVRVSNTIRSANWIATSYNNQSSPSTFYSVGSEEALPDLIVSYLSIPKAKKNRRGHIARVFVDYGVMNQGDGDAVASELDFYLSRDTVLDGSDTYVGTVNIPALVSGEETHRLLNAKKFKLSRPVSSSGTWYLLGVADADDDNVESDETNNVTAEVAAGSGR